MTTPEHAPGAEPLPCPHCWLDISYWEQPSKAASLGQVTIASLSHLLPACPLFIEYDGDPAAFIAEARTLAESRGEAP